MADYPLKDWKTGQAQAADRQAGRAVRQVTGTFAINSMTGFAASNGLLIHKRLQDAEGKVIAEGNAVLPPEAQTIQLEGKPAEKLARGQVRAPDSGTPPGPFEGPGRPALPLNLTLHHAFVEAAVGRAGRAAAEPVDRAGDAGHHHRAAPRPRTRGCGRSRR